MKSPGGLEEDAAIPEHAAEQAVTVGGMREGEES